MFMFVVFQTNAAFLFDGTRVLLKLFQELLKTYPEIYNSQTLGINCADHASIHWKYGPRIMRHLKDVSDALNIFFNLKRTQH